MRTAIRPRFPVEVILMPLYCISFRQPQPQSLQELLHTLEKMPNFTMVVPNQQTKDKYVGLGVPKHRIRVSEFDPKNPPDLVVQKLELS
jgi:hypothetical protein